MTAREGGEVKGIQGIAVQENGSTVVSAADTVNIVGGGTVTDVGGVATINIPYGAEWYREDVAAGSATYTFVHEPATATSFLIFTDSGTLLFSGIDYTYNASTHTVTFLSLDTNEAAYIWVAHANIVGGNVGDMVKAVYDPNNVQQNVYDYNYFINTPTIPAAQIQSDWNQADNTQVDYIKNKPTIPTTVAELSDSSDYVQTTDIANMVEGPASAVDGNIVLFDGATGKLIKDSGLNIQVVSTLPAGDSVDAYYNNGTIYLYVKSYIGLEDGNTLVTEDNNPLILES